MKKTSNFFEQPLPHSVDAEKALLAGILLDSPMASQVLRSLEPSDFFFPSHKVIFKHLKRLRALGMPTNDLVLLNDSIDFSSEFEDVGGAAYLAHICDGVPRVANLAHYAEIVRTKAQARVTLEHFQLGIDRILRANGDLSAVLEDIANHPAPMYMKFGQKESSLFKTSAEISTESSLTEFVVKPYLAAGAVTDLVAKIKAGKTTYALGELVQKALLKGPVVYLTEQPSSSFRVALDRAGLLNLDTLHILPFNAVSRMEWPVIAKLAGDHCGKVKAKLLVVDTVSHFAGLEGDSENNSGAAITCMKPLQAIAASGTAVLTIRHERKSGGEIGDAGRWIFSLRRRG